MTLPRVEFSFEMRAADLPMPASAFRRDARAAVAATGFAGAMSVAVVSDATMRRVNRDFHDCDAPTDVLAFPLGAGGDEGFQAEVVVSLETARREAKARGMTPAAELLLYVVHGALHLMGWDDHAPADARRMHARALSILERLGHGPTIRARSKSRAGTRRQQRSSP